MMAIKAVSLFSGCGGFDYGVQKAGAKIIWANDSDYHAAYAYQSIFQDTEFNFGDIRKVQTFPKADILIGCYPCTGFSEAARRRWKNLEVRNMYENDKNFLFQEFLRALKIVKPKFIFVENVRGMLSAGGGWFIQEQIKAFDSLGYRIAVSQVDASHFGVAQTRKRVFLVGVKKTIKDFYYTFPKPTNRNETSRPVKTLFDVIGKMPSWPDGEFYDGKFHGHFLTRNRKRRWDEPSFTIVAHAHHVPLHPSGDPMICIGPDKWALQGEFNRRLSWRECARIQGLTTQMKLDGKLEDHYRVVGNSVPPKLARVIVDPVLSYLTS